MNVLERSHFLINDKQTSLSTIHVSRSSLGSSIIFKSLYKESRHWWFTPVIPTTLEAEIGRITVQGQSGQVVLETSSSNNQTKMDWRCKHKD
jgi:hypothetical protein